MGSEMKLNSSPEDSTGLMSDESLTTQKLPDEKYLLSSINDAKIDSINRKDTSAVDLEEDKNFSNLPEVIDFPVSKRASWIKNPLIPMRVALLLWYGAARVPSKFLSVFLKQKGVSIVEISPVFSFTFLTQFLSASLSGIVADKIGDAKPVLMFHMLCSLIVMLCMLFAPSVNSKSCVEEKFACFDINQKVTTNLTLCNSTCIVNYTEYLRFEEITLGSEKINNFNGTNVYSLCKLLKGETSNFSNCFSSSLIDTLCDEIKDNCTHPCLQNFGNECLTSERTYMIMYAVLIVCFYTFLTTVYRFMDITVMAVIRKHDSNFGRERFVSVIGECFIAIFITFVMDTSSSTGEKYNYDSVYWVSACFIFFALVAVFSIRVEIKPPGRRLTKKAFTLIKNVDVVAFIAVVFVLGNGFCFNINFHLWFLDYLKAPKLVLGLHTTCFGMYGIPVLLTASWWLRKLGTTKIFVLSLLCYVINATSYSFLYNPWLSLIIESTIAFTYHLLWVAVVVHSHDIAPEGLVATVNAVSGAVHYGIGRSTSVLGGGLLMKYVGPRVTYRILAALCFVTAILYSLFLYRRHKYRKKESEFNGKEVEEGKSLQSDNAKEVCLD